MSARDDDLAGDFEGDAFERLLAEALEAIERGESVDVAALCRDHPELAQQVTEALARLGELPALHQELSNSDRQLGRLLGRRYRLDERIGAGAMGVVYRGYDLALQREVAVKLLRPELVVGERMDVRLAREGQVLARIRNTNVVTVFDQGKAEDGRNYLVMELLSGCNASQLLRQVDRVGERSSSAQRIEGFRHALGAEAIVDNDVRQVVRWIAAAAEGLHAAHEAGFVHRDVKPSNLFVDRNGRVVLLDFGIVSSGDKGTLGSDGSPFGTPAYMPPEQLDAHVEPDARSDVYGLAVTLYHLLTGRAPFDGTVQQVLAAIVAEEPVHADRVRPGLPVDLVAIVEKGMAKDAGRRYATAREFRDDLLAWLDYRPVSARRVSWLASCWRRGYRSPRVRSAGAVLLLVFLAAMGWQYAEARTAGRARRMQELVNHLPPSLVNDPPEYRAGSALRRSDGVARLLDEMVEVDDGPGIALAIRAVHRADCGDLDGAANDLEDVARRGNAPFAIAAVAEYRAGRLPDAAAQGENPPTTGAAGDRAVAVLHAMRATGPCPAWVVELLERDGSIDEHPGLAELRLLLAQRSAEALGDEAEMRTAFEQVEREALRLQALRGPSAIGCLVQMNVRYLQFAPIEGLAVAAQAVQLAPDCFALHIVAGRLALLAGDYADAARFLGRAVEQQPSSLRAHEGLCRAMIGEDRFDEVDALLGASVFVEAPEGAVVHHMLRGLLGYRRATIAWAEELTATDQVEVERPASQRFADAALQAFGEARRVADSAKSPILAEIELEEILCRDLTGQPVSSARVFELLAHRPLDAALLAHVAEILPDDLGPAEVEWLAVLLSRQAIALGLRER